MSDNLLAPDPKKNALVLIDLQKGVAGRDVAPYSAGDVIANSVRLADAFRSAGSLIVLVRVWFATDGGDRVARPTDTQWPISTPPVGWDEIVPELGPMAGDIVVTKRQWGAFYGTDLDLHLRRRGIECIVLGGIATCYGVESTARDAFEHNYGVVLVEDAMADLTSEGHAFTVKTIFPRIGRVRSTEQVLAAMSAF